MAADGAKLAKLFERKRLGRFAIEYTGNILGALRALAFGELARRWRRLAVLRVEHHRAVTDRPNILQTAQTHVWFGEQPSFFLGHGKTLDHRRRRAADAANDCAAF